ncbi:MAG: NfeD family protein [Phyllobacteriaceae bacterium]|nr:NfeD family protein [Phyllobacteriaceae bacterium]
MDIINYLADSGPWSWIIAGLVILGLELVVSGFFLVWLGIAAVLTGLITLAQPLPWPWQWLIFGVLSLASILVWTSISRRRRANSTEPELNRRTDRYIGHEAVLDRPIVDGYGRLALGDTIWRITGPDLPIGQRIRIVGADGAVLRVEAV